MMKKDLYKGFAERYDLVPDKLGENDPLLVEFFRQIFGEHCVKSVLDCACGTGRHLLLLHGLGCEVWGSDVSEAMLAQARKNLGHLGAEIPLVRADYRELPKHFPRTFDAVACLCSIGYMPDEKEFLRAFRSMYAVLRAGGILVLTAIPTDRQWEEKPRFELAVNTPDITRLFVMDYLERTVVYHILDIDHSPEINQLQVWSAELTVLPRDEMEKLLRAVGFRKVSFYGAFDFSPVDKKSSDRLIAVAYK